MAQFSRIKVWASGEVLYAADLNNEFNNLLNGFTPNLIDGASVAVSNMQAVFDPGNVGTENKPANLLQELQALRFMIKSFSGEAQWYVPPDTTFSTLAPFFNSTVKTDGTDPGIYGYTSLGFNLSLSNGTSGGTTSAALAAVSLTKGTRPVEIGCYPRNNPAIGDLGGVRLQIAISAPVQNTLTLTARILLLKNGSNFAYIDFPFAFSIPPTVRGNNIGGSNTLSVDANGGISASVLVNGGAGTVSGTGAENLVLNTPQIVISDTGLVNFVYTVFIPWAAFRFTDVSGAAVAVAYSYQMFLINPTLSGSSQTSTLNANGVMYAREIK